MPAQKIAKSEKEIPTVPQPNQETLCTLDGHFQKIAGRKTSYKRRNPTDKLLRLGKDYVDNLIKEVPRDKAVSSFKHGVLEFNLPFNFRHCLQGLCDTITRTPDLEDIIEESPLETIFRLDEKYCCGNIAISRFGSSKENALDSFPPSIMKKFLDFMGIEIASSELMVERVVGNLLIGIMETSSTIEKA